MGWNEYFYIYVQNINRRCFIYTMNNVNWAWALTHFIQHFVDFWTHFLTLWVVKYIKRVTQRMLNCFHVTIDCRVYWFIDVCLTRVLGPPKTAARTQFNSHTWKIGPPKQFEVIGVSSMHQIRKPLSRLQKLPMLLNILRPRQNCRHFADDNVKCIF